MNELNTHGDKSVQVMGLITQLEGKVRSKNEMIRELSEENTYHRRGFEDLGRRLGVKVDDTVDTPELVKQIHEKIVDLNTASGDWRVKYLTLWMLGYRNPVPLGVGLVVGGVLGWLVK